MFVKYNSLLRGFPADVVEACLGNGFVTTMHVINSVIVARRVSIFQP